MEYVISAIIVAAAVLVATLYLRRTMNAALCGRQQDPAMALLQNQVGESGREAARRVDELRKNVSDSLQSLTGQVSRSLSDSNRTVGDRLDNAAKVIGDVRQQLGQLEKSSQRMIAVGEDISRLEDILQPPKLRGSLGELFLGDLLAQILPSSHYTMQYSFKGGETVDAVIRLRSGLVPIDAKFPLENFRRILDAAGDEDARKVAKRAFIKDVKGHINSIAAKYIRMDENTFDFALMYIPAENVYYETIIKDDEFGGEMSLFNHAMTKRVIPVSPNSFYAYLQTIIIGLKGMRVEERSREIIEGLSRLRKEFDTFSDAFRLVGQHLDNSNKKFAEAQKRFGKVETKVEQIDGLARGLAASEQAAIPLEEGVDALPEAQVSDVA